MNKNSNKQNFLEDKHSKKKSSKSKGSTTSSRRRGPVDLDAYGEVVADYEIWRYDAASNAFAQIDVVKAAELKP